jgi:hypothetical protein
MEMRCQVFRHLLFTKTLRMHRSGLRDILQISPVFKQKKMELTATTLASVINHNPPWIPASSIQFAWFMSTGARKTSLH